jgi:hypothetical protein
MRRRLKRWAPRSTTTQLGRAAFNMSHAKDVLTIFRDVTAALGLSTLLFAYVWGVGYYDGLLGSLHVLMADFVEPRDMYSVFLRRGDFVVGLAGQIFLCGLLAGSFAVATRVEVRALRSRTKQVFVLVGQIVCPALVPIMVVLFPLLQARDAGRHDAEVYKADARSFQGKQGCRTVIVFDEQSDAPWPTSRRTVPHWSEYLEDGQ